MVWATLGDSVAGTSHRTRNVVCQDAFRVRAFGSMAKWLVIAVADGAGSASHSQDGATVVCCEFVRRVEALDFDTPDPMLFTRDGMTALFTDVRTALFAEAERLNVRP